MLGMFGFPLAVREILFPRAGIPWWSGAEVWEDAIATHNMFIPDAILQFEFETAPNLHSKAEEEFDLNFGLITTVIRLMNISMKIRAAMMSCESSLESATGRNYGNDSIWLINHISCYKHKNFS